MSPTLDNLVGDHGFISEEYYLHWYETFCGSPKQIHERLCSKWTTSTLGERTLYDGKISHRKFYVGRRRERNIHLKV